MLFALHRLIYHYRDLDLVRSQSVSLDDTVDYTWQSAERSVLRPFRKQVRQYAFNDSATSRANVGGIGCLSKKSA